jgi:hypothetical protein
VDNEVTAAAFLDLSAWDHVIPLVNDLTDGDRGQTDLEGRHIVIADDVLIAHLDREC